VTPAPLPPAQYYASLPRHIAGAGAIIHDDTGRILLLRPTYRDDTWEIPGGGLDAGEDPLACVQREIREELGIDLAPGRLLAVDWIPEQPDGRPALANYLFDGGVLCHDDAVRRLRLDGDEHAEWRVAGADQWADLLAPHMVRRLHACSRALASGTTAYLHHGWEPVPEP
jgi:8-oxo-dGTP pyrophosphatase MutT (NUDIX family)